MATTNLLLFPTHYLIHLAAGRFPTPSFCGRYPAISLPLPPSLKYSICSTLSRPYKLYDGHSIFSASPPSYTPPNKPTKRGRSDISDPIHRDPVASTPNSLGRPQKIQNPATIMFPSQQPNDPSHLTCRHLAAHASQKTTCEVMDGLASVILEE